MTASKGSWKRLSFTVPAGRRDELTAELWVLGTTGVHLRPAPEGEIVDAYFDDKQDLASAEHRAIWERCGAELIEAVEVESEDWLADYRAHCEPITVGPFVIDPREPGQGPSLSPVKERHPSVLRIPARNAFGTGSHESTRLILESLADLRLRGRSVLDVGTGSGILAFAALLRGARRVIGLDLDAGAVVTARDNARLNLLSPMLFAGSVDSVGCSFDVVLVNVLPERWLDEAGTVVDRLAAGGELLVSGLLKSQRGALLERLESLGLETGAERSLGEWTALRFQLGGPA